MTETDIEKRFEAVAEILTDRDSISAMSKEDLLDLHARAFALVGRLPEERTIPGLDDSYGRLMEVTDSHERQGLLEWLADQVDEGNLAGDALRPFVFLESDMEVVSTATLRYVVTGREGEEPLERVDEVTRQLDQAKLPGAVVGGLQLLGDPRVLDTLSEVEKDLSNDDIVLVAQCASWTPTLGSLEFWVRAMEEWSDAMDRATVSEEALAIESRLAFLALGFANVLLNADVERIDEVDRIFGFPWVRPKVPPVRHRASLTLRQVAGLFGPRLFALEDQEKRAPFTVPHLLRLLGLKPNRDPSTWSETASDEDHPISHRENRAAVIWSESGVADIEGPGAVRDLAPAGQKPEILGRELFLLDLASRISRDIDYPVPVNVFSRRDDDSIRHFLAADGVGLLLFLEDHLVVPENRAWLEYSVRSEMLSTCTGDALSALIDPQRREAK